MEQDVKVIIAGSRGITDYKELNNALNKFLYEFPYSEITEIVSGGARGVDELGERLAFSCNIPLKRFPAPWKLLGKKAGYLRNVAMAEYADALLAIWDGESKGTKHMIDIATEKGLRVYIHKVEKK